jgi:hypothetical protein
MARLLFGRFVRQWGCVLSHANSEVHCGIFGGKVHCMDVSTKLNVGGYQLSFQCFGRGEPTAVFEMGTVEA